MIELTEIIGACGHTRRAVVSNDPTQALKEIEQLVAGDCGACVKARRQSTRNILWSEVR
jgi:hypothetical protein